MQPESAARLYEQLEFSELLACDRRVCGYSLVEDEEGIERICIRIAIHDGDEFDGVETRKAFVHHFGIAGSEFVYEVASADYTSVCERKKFLSGKECKGEKPGTFS